MASGNASRRETVGSNELAVSLDGCIDTPISAAHEPLHQRLTTINCEVTLMAFIPISQSFSMEQIPDVYRTFYPQPAHGI
jgi:hypothetical protein